MRVKEVCLVMLALLIGLIGLVFVPGASLATTDDVAVASEQLYVTNVMVGQNDGRDLVVNFDLINETDFIQPDLRYAVILGQEYQDGLVKIIDWKKADDVVTVGAQEKLNKTIEYIAPDHLTGDYLVGIEVANSSGHIFGLVYGKKVSFSKESALIKLENCLWQIGDVSGVNNEYTSEQRVLIDQDDILYVSCEVVNDGEQTLTMNPVFSWHWRQMLGDEMKIDSLVGEQLNIVPGKNNIIVKTPKPIDWKPQAYDMVLYLTGGNGLVKTNQQALLAVVGGLSATIDNVRLNKNNYTKGEMAQVEVSWLPPADNFFGPEQSGSVLDHYSVVVDLWNRERNMCGNEVVKEYENFEKNKEIFSILVDKECLAPRVVVSLKDKEGNVFDKKDYQIFSGKREEKLTGENDKTIPMVSSQEKNSSIGWYLLGLVVVMILVLLFCFWKHRGNKIVGLLIVFFGGLSVMMSIGSVEAASWYWNGTSFGNVVGCPMDGINQTTVNVSTDYNSYRAGVGNIVVTVNVWTYSNSGFHVVLTNDNGQEVWTGPFNRYNAYGGTTRVIYMSVPVNAGGHGLTVRVSHTCARNNQGTLYYTVTPADSFSPYISNISPANGGFSCSNQIDLSGNIFDQDGGCGLSARFGNDPMVNGFSRGGLCNGSWFDSGTRAYSAGYHVWTIQGFDSYNHSSPVYWQGFTVNSAPNGISQNSPYNGQRFDSYGGSYWVNFNLSASDPDNNVNHMAVYVRNTNTGQQYVPACEFWSASGSCGINLPPGNYGWSACAWDTPCNAAYCNWSWRPFRVNDIPTMTITNLSQQSTTVPGCGRYNWTVYANDSDNISWDLNDNGSARMTPIRTSLAKGYTSGWRDIGYGNKWVNLSGVIRDPYVSVGATNAPSIQLNCEPNQPTQPTGSIGVCNSSTLTNPVTVSSNVSDPDGNVNVTLSIAGNYGNGAPFTMSQSLGLRSGLISNTFNIPFDSTVTQIIVSATDPVGGWTKSSSSNVWLSANKSPNSKVSDWITYPAGTTNKYVANSNPRFVMGDMATRLQPITVDDRSFDPDGDNQNVQATFWLEIYNAGTGSWQSLGSSALRPPTNIVGGMYYHDVPFNNLYAGQHRYRAQDRDACGAVSPVSSYYNFTIAPPAVKNIKDTTGDSGCPTCGLRRTKINIDWDDVPYILSAQSSNINGGYYVQWRNDGGTDEVGWKNVTKPSSLDPDLGSGYVRGSAIILETDVLDLYDLSTSTPRDIRYRVRSYSNGVNSDWLVYPSLGQPAITYNCPIPGGLLIFPPNSNNPEVPLEIRADEDSQLLTAKLRCQLFETKEWSDAYGDDLISAARSNRVYTPETSPITFTWDALVEFDGCSSGSGFRGTPPNPGNIFHAGTSTVMDGCEGKISATVRNFGWSDVNINSLTGYRKVVIDPRATEEFNYSGEVISNPPPGFEKLDLPGVQ